jgi:hypothetical protein
MKDTALRNLFDLSGRRIPGPSLSAPVNDATDRYGLAQPPIDYAVIHARITEHLGPTGVSEGEFAERAEGVLDTLRRDDETAPFAGGLRVPFMLGSGVSDDLGQALDETFLPALARSWKARFPKFDFKNELTGRLAGKVTIAAGSGYERLVEALAEGPVVGYYFPLALSGFSVVASRQQMSDLPTMFALSGGHEAAVALAGSPDLIMKPDGYPPQLEMAALQGSAPGYGYHFAPYGYNLTFNGRHHNGQASDYVSPGLTVIAPSRKKK